MADDGDAWDNIAALTLKAQQQRGSLHAQSDIHGRELLSIARALVRGTRLQDLKSNAKGASTGGLRKKLWDADVATVAASKDPLQKFVAAYDADLRAARKKYEEEVQGPLKRQHPFPGWRVWL